MWKCRWNIVSCYYQHFILLLNFPVCRRFTAFIWWGLLGWWINAVKFISWSWSLLSKPFEFANFHSTLAAVLDVFLRYLSTEALFKYFLTLTHSLIIRTKILTGSIEFDLILLVHYLAHENFFGSNQRLKNSRSCTLIFVKPPEYWVFPHLSSSGWSGPQELSLLPMGTSAPANSRGPLSPEISSATSSL